MSWNYRIVEVVDEEGNTTRGIYEVYYKARRPIARTEKAVRIMWDKGEDGIVFSQLVDCFNAPILMDKDIGEIVNG